jgi:hypothetical protein
MNHIHVHWTNDFKQNVYNMFFTKSPFSQMSLAPTRKFKWSDGPVAFKIRWSLTKSGGLGPTDHRLCRGLPLHQSFSIRTIIINTDCLFCFHTDKQKQLKWQEVQGPWMMTNPAVVVAPISLSLTLFSYLGVLRINEG